MRNVLFMLIALFCLSANAQEKKQEDASKSKTVELLKKRRCSFEKKDFYDIGKVAGATFQNIVITDISTGTKTGALRIETYYSSSLGTDTYIGTLDYDELAGCIKSLTYIKDNIITSIPENYVECEYNTKDGVSLGTYLNITKKRKCLENIYPNKKLHK
ncbi:MAG: hypothetical protein LUE99_06505 [Bacteroides sp.]|nr:hypothetical protein [Bacteroides sp.]